jgi:hypothetical protein
MKSWLDIVDEALCELPEAAFSDEVAQAQSLIHDVLNGRAAPLDLLAGPAGGLLPAPMINCVERCLLMKENPNAPLLRTHLELCVPLVIHEFVVGQRPLSFSRPDLAETIAAEGDAILYRTPGRTARAVSALVEAVAILAFCPGGVDFMGLHFEVPPEHVRATLAANGLQQEPQPGWALTGAKAPDGAVAAAAPTFEEAFKEVVQCLQPKRRRPRTS